MQLTKREFIQLVAINAKITQSEAVRAVDNVIQIIKDQVVTEGSFELAGLGTFRKSQRAEKTTRGFGTTTTVPEHYGTTFKPAPDFKKRLNEVKPVI